MRGSDVLLTETRDGALPAVTPPVPERLRRGRRRS